MSRVEISHRWYKCNALRTILMQIISQAFDVVDYFHVFHPFDIVLFLAKKCRAKVGRLVKYTQHHCAYLTGGKTCKLHDSLSIMQ
jgi:hypothetical protein